MQRCSFSDDRKIGDKKNTIGYYFQFILCCTCLFLLCFFTNTSVAQQDFSKNNFPIGIKDEDRGFHFLNQKGLAALNQNWKDEQTALSPFEGDCNFSNSETIEVNIPNTAILLDTVPTVDLTDKIKKILKKKVDSSDAKKQPGIAILPTLGYNPSLGFQIGAKVAAEKQFGDPKNTSPSVFGLIAVYTSKGIINLQAIHNMFTSENKMNWQGNWQLTFFQVTDYGLGIGNNYPDSANIIKYKFLRFFEKAYFKVAPNLYVGGGVNFNIRIDIDDKNQSPTYNTAHQTYSLENGFSPIKQSVNGLLAAIQFINRDHPFRAYNGIYADLNILSNQKWLGTSKSSFQAQVDFRKYCSLSKSNPAHVLAFWHLATYNLGGTIPYLEAPNTANDAYARSGRGYTIGRFRGPSYFYLETEYRFPVTRNQLISGVCFINTQSAANSTNKELMKYWASAAGGGLRLLFQKKSRSTICFDYAVGQYGAKGFFIGLNEAF